MANKFTIEMSLVNIQGKLIYNVLDDNFFNNPKIKENEVIRFLKGLYKTTTVLKEKLLKRFYNRDGTLNQYVAKLHDYFLANYDNVKPYSYREAFQIEDRVYRALVFSSINISEMIASMKNKRLAVDGREVTRKTWDSSGNPGPDKQFSSIFETYEVSGEDLGLEEPVYAVKCWCTSTNEEHWIWIEPEYKNKPLAAIASTFRFHENVIPKIKALKRQGDIMLVEMTEDVVPEGTPRPLTVDEYFGLLVAES